MYLIIKGTDYYSRLNLAEVKDTHQVFFYGGRYVDSLEKRDGEWRIALRRVVMDWNENWPGCTILDDGMSETLTLRGCRGHADPVFQNKP